jgi:transcriptional regulator with PAS, ATPase and Fis domain
VSAADSLGRFFPLNCGAFNESLVQSELFGHVKGAFTGADKDKAGVFESASGGYVFLDEIGDMPLSQQPKLLRALQERKIIRVGEVKERSVNFRTISASHVDLKKAVEEGRFREDLYFRVSKETIVIPPLRERLGDIRELAHHFISIQKKKYSITDDAINLLYSYAWPGNTRELQSVIDRAMIRADKGVVRSAQIIQVLPELASLSSGKLKRALVGSYGLQLLASERKRFQDAILSAAGDRDEAAKRLGLSRSTFFRKAKELGLVRDRKQALGLDL